jgi:lysophospholipase L1-like esterase
VFAGCAVVKRVLTQAEVVQFGNYLRAQYGMGTPRRIMWVGDSLTSPGQLAQFQAQYATDRAANPSVWGTYEATDADGVAGSTITQISTRLNTSLAANSYRQPDVIALLNCGTNDILQGATAAQVATRWGSLLANVHSLRPGVPIKLLSLVKNTSNAGLYTQVVIDANALGPVTVANAIAANPGMTAQWVNNIYDITLSDGTHPSDPAGEAEMAAHLWPLIKTW